MSSQIDLDRELLVKLAADAGGELKFFWREYTVWAARRLSYAWRFTHSTAPGLRWGFRIEVARNEDDLIRAATEQQIVDNAKSTLARLIVGGIFQPDMSTRISVVITAATRWRSSVGNTAFPEGSAGKALVEAVDAMLADQRHE